MAEPIRIIITQGGTGGTGFTGSGETKTPTRNFGTDVDKSKNNVGFSDKEQMALAGLVVAASRKAIVNSINNNMSMTGNYIQATRIQEQLSLVTHVGGIALAGYGIGKAVSAGLMSTPMAVIAVAGIVINEGMNIYQKVKQFEIRVNKENYQAERMRQRAGTSLGDGSRGTNE